MIICFHNMIFSLDVTNIFIYRGKNKNNRMFSFRRCKGREKEADVPLMAYMGMNLGYSNCGIYHCLVSFFGK